MIEVAEGFVRLVDSLGNDMSVVKAARVSYGNESKGIEADTKLINYMMKHKHGTPFEHINFTFHVKCPIFIARQWFRHRIGSFNEISGRYVKLDTLCWSPITWRKNINPRNKQDSVAENWDEEKLTEIEASFHNSLQVALTTYHFLLENGVAREQARAILPVGTYTEFYWTVNARSLFNFLELRTHHTAQKEMQEYAEAVYALSSPIAPISFKAWEKSRPA